MDPSDENVQTLLSMGFPSETEIRKALRLGKNDLNEAVAILTNEPSTAYDALDVEMKDVALQGPVYGPAPPSYDEVVDTEQASVTNQDTQHAASSQEGGEDEGLEFPVTNLYELENRVFTDSWSIPYKREESLGKCLIAATRLAEQGLAESHEFCNRFLDRCLPDCFQKLMTSGVVHRWSQEIQDGIYNMLQLLMDLVATRLQHHPVPVKLLGVLAMTFNPDTEYHYKNKSRRPDRIHWEEKFGLGQAYGVSASVNSTKEPYGYLTNLINRFADNKGFEHIQQMLTDENLDAPSMAALLEPFGSCSEMLNARVVQPLLAPGMEAAVRYIQGLDENDLKDKKVGSISDLLGTMKLLCLHMWTSDVSAIDEMRLNMALRMLKCPHFNARMNALKEVTKLIEDSAGTKLAKTAISQDKITTWLVNNNILSIALEGNIDQVQYCDKIKNIMDFLGDKLSIDELTKIWKMQHGQNNVVIDNIHSIIAAAAVKFNTQQLENLFHLTHKSWQVENHKMREKLLGLIGKIGKDAKIQKTTTQVLELLWDLAHLPALPTQLVEQALAEHLAILNDSCLVKEQVKRTYVVKCVDDIKEGVWVLPALKQLLHISKNIAKHGFHKHEKGILQELNNKHEIIKLVSNSLVKFHQMAVGVTKESKDLQLHPELLVDGRYSHREYVTTHLSFLQFILQEGAMYLQWHRARDIWDTMVANSDACDWDKETCIEWFSKGLTDLESDTQSQLFTKELLRLDASKLSLQGFNCFKSFFESVNQSEHRLKKSGITFVVEKLELVGMDYLWDICLNAPDEELADKAVTLLISVSFTNLAPRLKRDPVTLHKKFIDECYNRLELAMIPLGGSVVAQCISMATKLLTAASVPEVTTLPSPKRSTKLLNIERLLLIAERYVLVVEEHHTTARTILPHGASFHGYPMTLEVISESPKMEFNVQTHSNETMGSIRQKIAVKLKHAADQIQIVANDKMINTIKDQQLLHQLEFEYHQVLSVRAFMTSVSSTPASNPVKEMQDSHKLEEGASPGSARQSFDLEQEKMLPGVVMATGGHVFDRLYQLADLDEPRITTRARHLLKLIPTDPSVQDTLDSISARNLRQVSPEEIGSPKLSPRASPRKFTPSVSPSPKPVPKDILKNLFDASVTDMSPFRVLYNLEVLSSKLMPPVCDGVMMTSAASFCDDFLNAGGLNLVVNVLQKDTIAPDVDYETRQGCYAICLQLARFLLCGETVTGEEVHTGSGKERKTSVSSAVAIEVSHTASRAIQTMGVQDFTETVACFMRVAWAAAAGRLHLASSSQPIRENNSVYGGARSRQSSTGSTASSSSEGEAQTLHAGVCIKQSQVSTKDTNIAKEALELLVTCLQLRSQLIASFYSLPCVSDFVIDILVGSTQQEIRSCALEQLYMLAQTEISPEGSTSQQTPHHFILQVLLKARLPFWVTSCSTRGASQRLLSQCTQYFDLRCRLLQNLPLSEQTRCQVDPQSMLEDEIAWLSNFVTDGNSESGKMDTMLLAGHLNLIRTLFTCEGMDKRGAVSKNLVRDLLHDFMFPASKLIMDRMVSTDTENFMMDFYPKCSNTESRVAAYRLLAEIADNNLENLQDICQDLISMHHQPNPDIAHEWEYMPPVDSRSSAGFVGLRNGGATCYMNSVLQQLYMAPQVPESILTVEDESVDEESVFYQTQQVFGHLLDSKLQYYVPERFWKVFQLWGQSVNIREQQDAFDFYQALIDQLDEQLKKLGREEIFKKKFQGIFSDQKICKDCPHRFEREEVFFSLNVTVKNATLQDSLDQFVKGELLEGENAYFCEKCGEKRNTIKRMCIKTLPPLLCIQLKRFGYDWEANRALKFDDHFKFPWVLDMEPYTAEGMARREQLQSNGPDSSSESNESSANGGAGDSKTSDLQVNTSIAQSSHQINYELVGVIVHSGQANAGHYYSFIKDRRGTCMNNPKKGKWFKFNDTVVEEFEMNEIALENECFGGNYKAKVFDQANTYPEDRLRYWNGYLLFYERMEDVRTPLSAKRSRVHMMKLQDRISGSNRSSDSLVELTELVHKGEKKGIFTDKMPVRIQQVVRDENLRFMKNRDIFDGEYFKFVRILVSKNSSHISQEKYSQMCVQSLQLGVKFLLNTYFRTKKKLRSDMGEWISTIETLLQRCREACLWLIEYLGTESGGTYIKPFLLECPTREVRISFAKILERAMASFFHHGGVATHKCFTELLETLLQMLGKDVPDNIKTCTQYFWLLSMYVQRGTKACAHMFGRDAFHRLIIFLLGHPTTACASTDQEITLRKWSSMQARDFGPLHTTLATLILNCDLTKYRTEDPENFAIRNPTTVVPQLYLKMSDEMQKYVYGVEASRYLREVVLAVREVGGSTSTIIDMLVCCSFCNAPFSMTVLTNIMEQYTSLAPSSELKGLFCLLMEILLLEDPLQLKRLQCIIDGYIDENGCNYEGMLAVIKLNHSNDSRRSYQCIKFLVSLANKCSLAKDYLIQTPTKWQWAVNWLKKKMSDYWSPSANTVTSNEDSDSRTFQRTISAQDTLAEATALLTEFESHESQSEMDTNTEASGEQTTDTVPEEDSELIPKTVEDVDEVDERL